MTYPPYGSPPWQPSGQPRYVRPNSPSGPGRDNVVVAILAVLIVALLAGGGVGVAVTTASTDAGSTPPQASGTGGGGGGASSTPGSPASPGSPGSSTTLGPSPTTNTSLAPVSPLSVPPVTAPSVISRPPSLSPKAIATLVNPAVVDVDTRLGYLDAIAAGTGMIIGSNGIVLTNNHVINGATALGAVSVGTGQTFVAKVLGVDPSADIAVLQLQGAAGLPTVAIASTAARVGDPVVALGNAGGVGGAPSVTSGTVVGLDQSILASDPTETTTEQLNGLIETNANLQPGDSGGPLVNGEGRVIGMDTAAAANSSDTVSVSFAIPISQALTIAHQIEAGQSSATVHLGLPPFLGVQVQTDSGGRAGALVGTTLAGTPAALAGIVGGDLITAINGTAVDSSASLSKVLRRFSPGQTVTVTWIDLGGASRNARVTLASGPAD